ncbi:MAG: hypothetical protein HXS48_10135 [Theionarchaea archaeon]|nr:hypothetical protein [Theionarchaea archaeon]
MRIQRVTINRPRIKDVKSYSQRKHRCFRKSKIRREAYSVVIKENLPENVGVGGELILDGIKK